MSSSSLSTTESRPRPRTIDGRVSPAQPAAESIRTRTRVARGTTMPPFVGPRTGREAMFQEPFLNKWTRRLFTVPGLFLLTGLYGAALPLLAIYSLIADGIRRRPGFLLLRFHIYIFLTLFMQILGLGFLCLSYLYTFFMSPERTRIANRNVEIFFIPKTIALAEWIYGMKFEIENVECCAPGPILLLSRHASILDTIMPIKILGQALGMGMRIVQKHELMWNPVVDAASHRMPRAFIKRGSGDIESQIRHMKHLLEGIDETDALVVFPEGSRFSEAKKERIITKIAQSNPIAADRASRLKTVLPIRPAGTTALMDARPDMDVVFLAHTGLEGANRLEDFIGGALYKRTIRVKFWRVSASEIPQGAQERINWLHAEWSKLDDWIYENRES